jgi:hypothetical protein
MLGAKSQSMNPLRGSNWEVKLCPRPGIHAYLLKKLNISVWIMLTCGHDLEGGGGWLYPQHGLLMKNQTWKISCQCPFIGKIHLSAKCLLYTVKNKKKSVTGTRYMHYTVHSTAKSSLTTLTSPLCHVQVLYSLRKCREFLATPCLWTAVGQELQQARRTPRLFAPPLASSFVTYVATILHQRVSRFLQLSLSLPPFSRALSLSLSFPFLQSSLSLSIYLSTLICRYHAPSDFHLY